MNNTEANSELVAVEPALPIPLDKGPSLMIRLINGSMAPKFPANSYALCIPLTGKQQMKRGSSYVYHSRQGYFVKVFEGFADNAICLRSMNPTCSPVETIPIADVTGIYSVEWKINKAA
ncbi:S24 family peptidase [Fibrivirga algicola]|uniref:S24 family peptidase n=1 Tax=Fibrivirga algicola TaxID=2950420 RepID=UPI0035B5FD9E